MPKKMPEIPAIRPGDSDDEVIRKVVGEQYGAMSERDGGPVDAMDTLYGISPEELVGELGPRGKARAEREQARKKR